MSDEKNLEIQEEAQTTPEPVQQEVKTAHDDFDWSRRKGPGPNSNSGPSHSDGYYLFANSKNQW